MRGAQPCPGATHRRLWAAAARGVDVINILIAAHASQRLEARLDLWGGNLDS